VNSGVRVVEGARLDEFHFCRAFALAEPLDSPATGLDLCVDLIEQMWAIPAVT
jgi:hypothetical protein